jgi:hypothetical protein
MREHSLRFHCPSNFGQTFAFSVYSEGNQFEYAKGEVDQAARTNVALQSTYVSLAHPCNFSVSVFCGSS